MAILAYSMACDLMVKSVEVVDGRERFPRECALQRASTGAACRQFDGREGVSIAEVVMLCVCGRGRARVRAPRSEIL
jgi:hypothetical protein